MMHLSIALSYFAHFNDVYGFQKINVNNLQELIRIYECFIRHFIQDVILIVESTVS